jgi:hypothetical protein
VDPFNVCLAVPSYRQPVVDVDPLDDQDAVLGLDLADRFALRPTQPLDLDPMNAVWPYSFYRQFDGDRPCSPASLED